MWSGGDKGEMNSDLVTHYTKLCGLFKQYCWLGISKTSQYIQTVRVIICMNEK